MEKSQKKVKLEVAYKLQSLIESYANEELIYEASRAIVYYESNQFSCENLNILERKLLGIIKKYQENNICDKSFINNLLEIISQCQKGLRNSECWHTEYAVLLELVLVMIKDKPNHILMCEEIKKLNRFNHRRYFVKENGVTKETFTAKKPECYTSKNKKVFKQLCWDCPLESLTQCKKMTDGALKAMISDYDFITDGYQIVNIANVSQELLVSKCSLYDEFIANKEEKSKYLVK